MASYLISAFAKIVFIGIALGIWAIFVEPYADGIKDIVQWWFNQSVYPMITESTAEFVAQTFVFLSGYKILTWIFAPGVHETEGGASDSGNIDQAHGFTTRSLYS